MKLLKLDINKHDLNKVSELIYDTDAETFNFYFKNKKNTAQRILKIVKQRDNSMGYKNIYVATQEEDNNISGILVAYIGREYSFKNDLKTYFNALNPFDALKFLIFDIIDHFILADLKNDDFYLAAVAVNEDFRGKGIGTFILEKSKELARKKGCKRVVLDVDLENNGALRLYERFGFNIYNKKSIRWFHGEKGAYNMDYLL